jgi:hypothetical protein
MRFLIYRFLHYSRGDSCNHAFEISHHGGGIHSQGIAYNFHILKRGLHLQSQCTAVMGRRRNRIIDNQPVIETQQWCQQLSDAGPCPSKGSSELVRPLPLHGFTVHFIIFLPPGNLKSSSFLLLRTNPYPSGHSPSQPDTRGAGCESESVGPGRRQNLEAATQTLGADSGGPESDGRAFTVLCPHRNLSS